MIRAMAAFVAVASVSAAVSAHAAESVGHPATTAVYMNRTDLRDPAAVKVLYGKLARAAQDVCTTGAIGRFVGRDADQACMQHTLDAAVAQVNRPLLTAMHLKSVQTSLARGY